MSRYLGSLLILLLLPVLGFTQKSPELTSSEIYQKLEKLGTLANVLYIAAHPDDENTSLISFFSNEKHYETTYLSLTRGDGGQNLIGPEIGPLLGVIRTEELLAARDVDGGTQMFTRAVDFGYSKNPEETFDIWNKEKVLHDVVWAIRKVRPDIIVNRFDHRTSGTTHGHHTGSAILSYDAFDLAGDPSVFPDQLKWVEPWQPRRLYFNTSWWFYGSQEKFEEADKSGMTSVDVGVYYPLLGKSNNEISALSRSQHRCQGFGRVGARGTEKEYLEFLKGDKPSGDDPFSGINTSWSRVPGGAEVQQVYDKIMADFDFEDPSTVTLQLMKLYELIQAMPENAFKIAKLQECEELLQACSGLFLQVRSSENHLIPGEQVSAEWEVINRSSTPMKIKNIEILPLDVAYPVNVSLEKNIGHSGNMEFVIPADAPFTNPYWLNYPHTLGLYHVSDEQRIGLPETPRYLKARFELEIGGQEIVLNRDVVNVIGRPDRGEIYRPVEIIPAYTLTMQNPILFLQKGATKTLGVQVYAHHADRQKGDTLTLSMPVGFSCTPAYYILEGEPLANYSFEISGPDQDLRETVQAVVRTKSGKSYDRTMTLIDYEHIPLQTVLQPAETTVVSLQVNSGVRQIGYLQGAGDEIPRFLAEIGIQSKILTTSSIPHEDLAEFDAIVLGIRALNTIEDIGAVMPDLLQYAHEGGTLVLQYNTNRGLKTQNFSPFKLELSRVRVTDENSPVRILKPQHKVLNEPNAITLKDFEGWVQERGLYFPGDYGGEFETVVAFKDPGEEFLPGSLLIAPYGQGYYVYTGLSFFRELPAGVPGAFKLFVNILSLNKKQN
ncbi:PIG-L family deacetylase [Membranicola marinus]|uniref:PIG-L family deacetylase n=1 Tax=Membranihabitans marinus TaxID=1227546 RepID=A0A953L6H8_9BACT|nr:PIG-L family deacetylase [Membranihabitans marinus]MBY5957657.1 PIG-L family deacetylase [Membranihabitans marinus]